MLLGTFSLAAAALMISAFGADPLSTAAWRCLLAVPMLAPVVVWELRRTEVRAALPPRTVILAVLAGTALGVDYGFYNTSILLIGAGLATVLINIQIVVVPLLAWLIEGTRPPKLMLAVAPAMLLGVALAGGAFDPGPLQWGGVLAGLAAGVGYALYLSIIRRSAPTAVRPAPCAVLTLVCLSAGLTTLVAALLSGRLQAPENLTDLAWFAAIALIGQVITYLCFNIAMTSLPENLTSALQLLTAVFALILGAALLGQIPTVWQLAGCGLIIAGAWAASRVSG